MKVQNEIDTMLKQLPKHSTTAGGYHENDLIELRGGHGSGSPEFSTKQIWFNGNRKKDLDHETFHFEFNKIPFDFAFCKTARKPYDFVVCICLLSLANNLEGFEMSSDGDLEDWQPAINFYENIFGKLNPNVLNFLND